MNHDNRKQPSGHRVCRNALGGFTLLEALIAIVILSSGLLGMASLLGSIMGYNLLASNVTAATTLAQDKLEELKNNDYDSTSSSESPEIQSLIYKRSWSVAEDSPAANMKTISVKVAWTWRGLPQNVELSTIITR